MECSIKRLALVQAIIAEIEGMKIKNIERSNNQEAPAYSEEAFYYKADELRILAAKHNYEL